METRVELILVTLGPLPKFFFMLTAAKVETKDGRLERAVADVALEESDPT